MTEEILKAFEPDIEQFTLIPSDGGRFELVVNGDLLYSKLQTHRHMEPGEAERLIRQHLRGR